MGFDPTGINTAMNQMAQMIMQRKAQQRSESQQMRQLQKRDELQSEREQERLRLQAQLKQEEEEAKRKFQSEQGTLLATYLKDDQYDLTDTSDMLRLMEDWRMGGGDPDYIDTLVQNSLSLQKAQEASQKVNGKKLSQAERAAHSDFLKFQADIVNDARKASSLYGRTDDILGHIKEGNYSQSPFAYWRRSNYTGKSLGDSQIDQFQKDFVDWKGALSGNITNQKLALQLGATISPELAQDANIANLEQNVRGMELAMMGPKVIEQMIEEDPSVVYSSDFRTKFNRRFDEEMEQAGRVTEKQGDDKSEKKSKSKQKPPKELPDPAQHKGKTVTDKQTGIKWKSEGDRWYMVNA